MKKFEHMALLGCGLMGGSFALAAKKAGVVKRIVGYSKSPSTTSRARQLGVIDEEASSAMIAVSGADLVILAIPVGSTEPMMRTIKHLIQRETLIMDVGSTKVDVVTSARLALKDRFGCFVPAHPITGKSVSGVDNADADLYQNAQVILTPTERTKVTQLRDAEALWAALGSHVTSMTPEAHDAALAASSHAPHLIAMAYMNMILAQDDGHRILSLAGPGFRDFSRIAASEPKLWRDIFCANRNEILKQVHYLQHVLGRYEAALMTNDSATVEHLVRAASKTRAQWKLGKLYTPQSLKNPQAS